MAIREILVYPHPELKKTAEPVKEFDEELQTLGDDLVETMLAYSGLGLAANQVGVQKRVVVMLTAESHPLVLVNPEIIEVSEEMESIGEGCLSFPGYVGKVNRPLGVTVRSQTVEGEERTMFLEGMRARCLLHEVDHLDGKVFIEKTDRHTRRYIGSDIRKRKKYKNLRYVGFDKTYSGK